MAHIISSECVGCGSCVSECPVDAISEGSPYVVDAGACTDCGNCVPICPVSCISVV
jgi:ferredoxin